MSDGFWKAEDTYKYVSSQKEKEELNNKKRIKNQNTWSPEYENIVYSDPYDIVEMNVRRSLEHKNDFTIQCNECLDDIINSTVELNHMFMSALPQYFEKGKDCLIMTSPTGLVFKDFKKYVVCASTRSFKHRTSIQYLQDISFFKEVNDVKLATVAALVQEFEDEARPLVKKGYMICPYIPVLWSRSVDESTFEPLITYKTRYGVLDIESE